MSGEKKKDGKEDTGSQAITEDDYADSNKRGKEVSSKAPEPVIGLNDERGAVCFHVSS